MWHVSSRSGVATLRTAIHLLLTYSASLQCVGAAMLTEGRPRFDQRPSDTQVFENWPTVIAWTVSDLSDPVVAWYRDGSPIFVSRSTICRFPCRRQ